ncbi:MAG: hypothetical protein AAB250_03395, partial [Bdellovibrionota bacterium]
MLVGLLATVAVSTAHAKMTYEGQIIAPNGQPLTGSVDLKVQIRTPGTESCLMYEEVFTTTAAADGYVSVVLNDGAGSRIDASGFGFDSIFSNKNPFPFVSSECADASTSYVPVASDGRKLVIQARPSGPGTYEIFPALAINAVPYATQASEASAIDGFASDALVRVGSGSISPLTIAVYNQLLAVGAGTSSAYQQYGKLQGVTLPALTNGQVLGWSGGVWAAINPASGVQTFATTPLPTCAGGDFLKDDGSGALVCATPSGSGTVTNVSGTGPLSVTNPTTTPSIAISLATGTSRGYLSSGDWTAFNGKQAAIGYTTVNKAGDTMTGAFTLNADPTNVLHAATKQYVDAAISGIGSNFGLLTAGTVSSYITSQKVLQMVDAGADNIWIKAPDDVPADWTLYLPPADGAAGDALVTDGAGSLSWAPVAGGGNFISDGSVPMDLGAQLALDGGSVNFPALTFNGDFDTGLFSPGIGEMTFVSATVPALHIAANAEVGVGTQVGYGDGSKLNVANGFLSLRPVGFSAGDAGQVRFFDLSGGNHVAIRAPDAMFSALDYTLTLPDQVGNAGDVLQTDGTGILSWVAPAGSPTALNAPATSDFHITTDGGYSTVIDASTTSTTPGTGAFVVTGGVGIGGALNVAGGVSAGSLTTGSGSFGLPSFRFIGDPDTGLYSPAADVIGFSAAGAPRVEITSTDMSTTQFNASATMSIRRAEGSYGSPTALPTGMTIGATRFQAYDGSTFADGAVVAATSTEAWNPGARGTSLTFATTANGTSAPVPRVTVGDNGNVGIGTTSPGQNLSVMSTSPGQATVAQVQNFSTSGASRYISSTGGGALSLETYGSSTSYGNTAGGAVRAANGASLFWEGGGGPLNIASLSQPIRFMAGGDLAANEHMRIDISGNVGIGTTSPFSKFEVAGAITMKNASVHAGFQAPSTGPNTVYTLPNAAPAAG